MSNDRATVRPPHLGHDLLDPNLREKWIALFEERLGGQGRERFELAVAVERARRLEAAGLAGAALELQYRLALQKEQPEPTPDDDLMPASTVAELLNITIPEITKMKPRIRHRKPRPEEYLGRVRLLVSFMDVWRQVRARPTQLD
jgi:hypothetical protein